MPERIAILPADGTLLVSTDVHGCGDDFRRMEAIWCRHRDGGHEAHWVILGDVVHAPHAEARSRRPELYDYEDESWEIVHRILTLQAEAPEHVHFVLGNHDWAHIGGPRTAKFYADEAAHLEDMLSPDQVLELRDLFRNALLCAAAPCGAFMSHASPGALPDSLAEIDAIAVGGTLSDRERGLISHFTTFYGQREAVTRSFLRHMSELCDLELSFVVHGHDRDEDGWFVQEATQICPVIFGAPRENKRYLRLDLAARYNSVDDLKDGSEIARLWADD